MREESGPYLVLVTARQHAADGDLPAAVDAAVSGGVDLVILREKDLGAGDLLDLARRVRAVTRGRALLLVNDRVDVALAAEADGVHLGEAGLPVEAARQVVAGRSGFLIGRSVHSVESAGNAARADADYLLAGNIFPTASHPGRPGAGTEFLAAVAGMGRPVYAIGGITAGNAADCLRAGARGVAVITAILGQPDPEGAARCLRAALDAEEER